MARYHDPPTVSQEANCCSKTVLHKEKKLFTDSKREMRKFHFLSEGQRSVKTHLNSTICTFILGCQYEHVLFVWVILLLEPAGHGLPDFCYVWHKGVLLRSEWIKVLREIKFIAPQKVLLLLTWGWVLSLVFRGILFPMLLLTKPSVTDTFAQRQGIQVHLELQGNLGNVVSAGSSPSY